MFDQFHRSRRRLLRFLFLSSLTFCLLLGLCQSIDGYITASPRLPVPASSPVVATAQTIAENSLVQQGVERYQSGDFQGAIAAWETVLSQHLTGKTYSSDELTALKNLVRAYQQIGRVERAIADLDQLMTYYHQIGDFQQVGRMLTEKAQAYSSLGQHKRAIAMLGDALEIARSHSDDLGQAAALGSLGNTHFLRGEYDRAILYLEDSLGMAQELGRSPYISTALNSLGNIYTRLAERDFSRARQAQERNDEDAAQKFRQNAALDDGKAIHYFEDSLRIARTQRDLQSEVRTLLNLSLPYRRSQRVNSPALDPLQQAPAIWQSLPDSRGKIYDAIKLANLLQLTGPDSASGIDTPAIGCSSEPIQGVKQLLNQAVSIAQHIQDRQAESYALGALGHIYECDGDYDRALSLTQQAQIAAVTKESLYWWEWQAGRIFKAQAQNLNAIDAYAKSLKTLKSIRGDIVIAGRDFQLDFRETIEPIYRQFTELRLEQASSSTDALLAQTYLKSALETIDELRLAELQNYLGNDCELTPIEKPVTSIEQNTAVFSSIILKERTAIILTLPDGSSKSQIRWLPVDSNAAIERIDDLRLKLEKRSDRSNSFRESARQVYDWLIFPFASELERAKVETLVFIQDGILRSVPMAALHDGQQFLIQKYAIANVPSLTLVAPTRLKNKELRVLAFGLTKPSQVDRQTFFQPLNYVKSEIKSILDSIPKTKFLLDEDFTPSRLKQELERANYPIIHIATHGRFGFDANETYLVTGLVGGSHTQKSYSNERYNEKLTMNELYQILRSARRQNSSIELLTLTACETAVGSDRDALGIAGISLQAGVQSAIASLWQVDDAATAQIIAKFYQGLSQGLSKAKALQVAQTAWLEAHLGEVDSHPGFWSPFILIGNWL